jgi:DNA-binding beta-propeller fold protein YncE
LKGVAGALVDEGSDLVFTSNRGEDTVSILTPDGDGPEAKVGVGMRPNGLAYDPARGLLLSANVGNVDVAGSYSVSLVDVRARTIVAGAAVPGRTRWTVFDPSQGVFFVNIMDPPRIAVVDPAAGGLVARLIDVPAGGPHGLDVDPPKGRLYCACDDGTAVCLDSRSGRSLETLKLSGAPDVVFLNRALRRLYVAIGDPGVVDVIDVSSWRRVETVETERGAHTIAFEEGRNRVYAFLPETHRASVYEDRV